MSLEVQTTAVETLSMSARFKGEQHLLCVRQTETFHSRSGTLEKDNVEVVAVRCEVYSFQMEVKSGCREEIMR